MLSTWIQSKKDEEGFTLIELLVVVIIIGILAAIAIPVFLNQRQSAWEGSVESDLRNAAIQMETLLQRDGSYAAANDVTAPGTGGSPTEIGSVSVATSPDVTLEFEAGANTYTITGTHDNLGTNSIDFSSNGGLGTWNRGGGGE